jgi:hypothetical protein
MLLSRALTIKKHEGQVCFYERMWDLNFLPLVGEIKLKAMYHTIEYCFHLTVV